MQRLCHEHTPLAFVGPMFVRLGLVGAALFWSSTTPVRAESPVHDYPTQARVEYVNECVAKHGDRLSAVYQCSCAIDRIANSLSYEDFVEASTFSRYAALPGEGGAIFRDSDQARKLAKRYRELETDAQRVCGLES